MNDRTRSKERLSQGTALRFVVLLGIVSLFGDMTYEGARSVTGPYLALLGASGTAVGMVAGCGELLGYGLRLASGYLSDRTRRYWAIALAGYAMNMLAVPLLALAGRWEVAAALVIAERVGKAIRTPSRDTMLSHATQEMGRGWGFGLHEALDQIGAVLGPLLIAAVLYFQGGYRVAFAVLLVPALLSLAVLLVARSLYPHPRRFEIEEPDTKPGNVDNAAPRPGSRFLSTLPRKFWIYLVAVGLVAAGYADFPLIAYHLGKNSVVSPGWIPTFYAAAMAVDAVSALVFGRLFDRIGLRVLVAAALISSLFAPLVFLGGFAPALIGMIVWGVGMGAQESIMRAAIAGMVPPDRRGTAYGTFNAGYGLAWFLGSALMGVLYDLSPMALIGFSVGAQLLAVPVFLAVSRR